MKKIRTILQLGLTGLLLTSGCMTQKRAERIISETPEYFQKNIGPVKVEPLNPLGIFFAGYVFPKYERDCPIHALVLANKDTVYEEAFHSFEWRCILNRPKEWIRFYSDFHQTNGKTTERYYGIPLSLVLSSVPFLKDLPVKGNADLYGKVSHLEDTGGCFRYYKRHINKKGDAKFEHKVKCIEKFINGGYVEPTKTTNNFFRESIKKTDNNTPSVDE